MSLGEQSVMPYKDHRMKKPDASTTLALLNALDDEEHHRENAKLITLSLLSHLSSKQADKTVREMVEIGVLEL